MNNEEKEIKIEAELVDDGKPKEDKDLVLRKEKAIKKIERIKLSATDHYITRLLNKDPKELLETIFRQTDTLMILSKEVALLALERMAAGDPYAESLYKTCIQGAALQAEDRIKLTKAFTVDSGPKEKNTPYKAEILNQEEWEKAFKPGEPVVEKKTETPELYAGPTPKEVN